MSVSRTNLKIEPSEQGFFILANKEDAQVLFALFPQYGLSCYRDANVRHGVDALRFFYPGERDQAEIVLHRYRTTPGVVSDATRSV